MEAAEAASASLGPRYAPEDPTLPKPWKGLMDGSTGVLYYWNPETNVTQYEKPSALPPPGQPKLAPIPPPHSYPQNTVLSQAQSQSQSQPQPQPQPQSQQGQQLSQHGYQMQHQQSPQLVQPAMQPHQHAFQPMSQQRSGQQGPPHQIPGQQGPPHQMPGQQGSLHQMQGQQGPPHQMPGQQGPPHQMPGQQGQPQMMPGHQGFQNQGTQMAQGQQQLMHHQMNCGSYQPSMFPQGQQAPQQYAQQPYANQQDFKPIFPNKEEDGYQNKNRNQMRFHQAGQSQNFPTGAAPVHPGQPQQLSGSSNKIHQMQPNGDLAQNPISRFQPERDMSAMHNQQPNMPPSGLRPGLENSFGRVGNDFTYNSNQEVPVGSPQQPKLSAVPTIRSHQGTRFSAPYPNTTPGHVSALNNGAGYAMPNVHGHAPGGPPLSNSAGARPAYIGTPEPSSISSIESYRQQHEVTASGDNVPAPFVTFESTGFPPEILREMFSAGFSSPTPIQAQTWPIALQSRDIVAIAKTGSGKTLGYLIPAFLHLQQRRNNSQKGPTVLVLAPTRELATQIQDEVVKFGRSSRVSCTCLYGGAPKGAQLKELERGADIVVATPGRLNDILEMKRIDFWQVSLLILDEADRMLDMGFEPQIRKIVNEIPPRRQTLMFTATWPKEVRKIAGDLLVSPVQVNIGNVDELSANKAITQYVEVVPPMEKQRRLEQILRSQERGSKIIIFCSTKRLCDQLTRNIGRNFGAAAIHGDKSQGERDWVLNQFRSGKTPVLVATDVAARGLDIKDIRVVINYDFPTGIEDYVHRIGRTGRAGATGLSYTFFSEQDWKYATDLIKLLEGANQRVPQDIREIAMRGGPGFGKDRRFDRGGGRGFGGRGDFFDGGNRGRGFSGPDLGRGGFGRNDRVIHGGYNMDHGRGQMDHGRGFGRGGRGRFDSNRRDSGGGGGRGRDRSYSRSPERVRTWGYNSKRQSRSRSWSRSRSRSRSRSYSRSPRRRSRSRSYERRGAPGTKQIPELKDTIVAETPDIEAPGLIPTLAPPETELVGPAPAVENVKSEIPEAEQDPVAGGEH